MKRDLASHHSRFSFKEHYQLYLMVLPALAGVLLFSYGPMYGIIIAFKKYIPFLGYSGSEWVGFDNFNLFFHSMSFWRVIRNTLTLSIYSLVAGFPIPVILAISIHYMPLRRTKRVIQTVTYAPHFISMVVLVGMINIFFSQNYGTVNRLVVLFGSTKINFLGNEQVFPSLYVWTGIWQNAGWGAVIYLAALSGVDPSVHESAVVDGASIIRRIWHIDLPSILPTIFILLILNFGRIMSVGYEKVFLMQNALNLETSEIISTYVYKQGLIDKNYSYSTAIGLFNSVINFILLVTVNRFAKILGQSSLW